MYNFLKSVVKNIIPKEILIKNEDQLRKLLKPFYQGKNHICTICQTNLKQFVKLENGDLICPVCGSLPRTRRLNLLLETHYLKPNSAFLDFSPSRMLYKKWKKRKDISYFPTDFENEFLSDYRFDITKIDAKENTFDLIVCYHILEHIVKDEIAMKELYRVLKPGGSVLIQTPFKNGEIYEDYSKTTPQERLKYFGQDDHVRIYSVSGLEKRLNGAGFKTDVQIFEEDIYQGFSKNEVVIVCRK
ncbi:class I SAM-dependent methyltransferase [Chryseobacterium caseinilyticum]|uniref:Methyltransferase domain-containing protein n=1 Tax=Chryseobacterium caseinilyticum TaxID=2771428 RepID=A0ABR8ZB15_9FLAO|nr:class I SAM-dependent methyltransferase [Chryseobacterium caseinilyticum]MBD8082274.1 methyltransferase domain-containing protein [Chryseobacterium caseinilyticum]